jgi:hypothetical protein
MHIEAARQYSSGWHEPFYRFEGAAWRRARRTKIAVSSPRGAHGGQTIGADMDEKNAASGSGDDAIIGEENGSPFCDVGRLDSAPWRACESRADSAKGTGSVNHRRLDAILAKLRELWWRQAAGARTSRLDGATIFTEAQWAALGESAFFARLRDGGDDQGGSGAPIQALPPSLAPRGDAQSGRLNESLRGKP